MLRGQDYSSRRSCCCLHSGGRRGPIAGDSYIHGEARGGGSEHMNLELELCNPTTTFRLKHSNISTLASELQMPPPGSTSLATCWLPATYSIRASKNGDRFGNRFGVTRQRGSGIHATQMGSEKQRPRPSLRRLPLQMKNVSAKPKPNTQSLNLKEKTTGNETSTRAKVEIYRTRLKSGVRSHRALTLFAIATYLPRVR